MERNQTLKKRSQELRRNQTKEESLLWYCFLSKYPHRFRRQYVIGNYIADFYCHKVKLVVELDGSQHYEPEEIAYDRKRTFYLESQGLKVLRFTNMDIQREFRAVCEAIDTAVNESQFVLTDCSGHSGDRRSSSDPLRGSPSPREKVFAHLR